jgi:hypothetical protein
MPKIDLEKSETRIKIRRISYVCRDTYRGEFGGDQLSWVL